MRAASSVVRFLLALALATTTRASAGVAQTAVAPEAAPRAVFGVGEVLLYDVKYGPFNVGTARMEVVGIDTVRGRPAWHTKLEIEGGIPGYRVHDVLESWIEVATFHSLRHRQETVERNKQRLKVYEIFPERRIFKENEKPEQPTVEHPLDEGAFIFFVRGQPLELGQKYDFDRYFIPDRNPVTVIVDRREKIDVPAGNFPTIVIKPVIKAKGVFSQNGRAEIWFTDDERRLMVRMETHVVFGTISLRLREFTQGAVTP